MSCNRRLKKRIGLNNGYSLFPSGSAGQLLLVWPSSMGVPRCQLSHILLFQRVQAVRLSLVPNGILSPSRQDQDSSQHHHRAQQEGISCNMQASYKLLLGLCLLLSHWSNQAPSQNYCGRDDPSGRYGEA